MLTLGSIVFAFPWALLGLLLLPLLWRRLRATPPAPQVVLFPPVRLLKDLAETHPPAAAIPPWLLALRLAALAVLIVACAAPRLEREGSKTMTELPLLLVIDDGWSAAASWERRIARAEALAATAGAAGLPVHLLRLAPAADGTPPRVEGPLPAAVAIERIRALRPLPWPARPDLAANALKGLPAMQPVWIRGTTGAEGEMTLGHRLATLGSLILVEGGPPPILLSPETDLSGRLAARIRRIAGPAETWTIEAMASGGRILGRVSLTLAEGETTSRVSFEEIPPAVATQAERLRIQGRTEAAAQASLPPRTNTPPLLIGTPDDLRPLTGAHWYVSRALGHGYHLGGIESLGPDIRIAVLPDRALAPDAPETQALETWVAAGGTLLRFAGPAVAEAPDQPLLPGALRRGVRALDGGLAWSPPSRPGPGEGPLEGVPSASDAPVLRHVLLQPEARPEVWIRLDDGAALVSSAPFGRGRVILVHVPSVPGWSDVPLSAAFPVLVQRIAALAEGRGATVDPRPARLTDAIDALGHPMPTGAAARAVPARDLVRIPASPEAPPGVWITADGTRIVRALGPALPDPIPPTPIPADHRDDLDGGAPPTPLTGYLAALALLALLVDHLISLRLRGAGWLPGRGAAAAIGLAIAVVSAPAWAQGGAPAQILPQLAHVATGDTETDRIVALGLRRLAEEVTRRTSARLEPTPAMVRPGRDPIALYPILYWPVGPKAEADQAATQALRAFMAHGGLLVLDTRDGGTDPAARAALDRIVRGLGLPALGRIPPEHVLNQTFFLLRNGQPGRLAGAPVWIVAEPDPTQDGITPILVGANDWALGWASDPEGRPLAAFLPGGQAQRIQALRFGINLVLYALTGNYKGDQVHVSAILERLGQPR